MNKPPLKPFGRLLTDFGQLKPAEQILLDACRKGECADISDKRPEQATEQNTVRADFVRFLALGGDEYALVHEMGVQLQGAWIEEDLNLQRVTLPHSLGLLNCHFSNIIRLLDSNVKGTVCFSGSHVSGLAADGMRCRGSVFLNDGFITTGTVNFNSVQIVGSLQCQSAKFYVKEGGEALICDGAVIKGGVFLNEGFTAIGLVSLVSTQIGDLICNNARFNNAVNKGALICDGAVINGNVILAPDLNDISTDNLFPNFSAIGTVNLSLVRIGGNLECQTATFNGSGNPAFKADGMTVTGAFHFHDVQSVNGIVSLSSAKVSTLIDHIDSWKSELILDGFVYDSLTLVAPTDSKTRIA